MYLRTILEAIGHTPMVRLSRLTDLGVFAKAEFLNPGGSVKDRVALNMIEKAEAAGKLGPGCIICEPTSGNTGIGITLVGVHKGYRVMIVMPENMSEERKKIILALGGELVLTPAEENIQGAVDRAAQIAAENPCVFVPQQFENPDNPAIHYEQTAVEIWEQMEGRVDAFVAGVGSGGTLAGVSRFLKERDRNILCVAVEPTGVSALLGHEPGLHQIQGIGDGFIPAVLDVNLVDEVVEVTDEAAIETARELARTEACLVGTSSGANVWAAMRVAGRLGPGKNVVTIMADRAERYFSTALI
jgi:cysteine synthase A